MRKELTLKNLTKLYGCDLKYPDIDWTKSCTDVAHTESVGAINTYADFRKKMSVNERTKRN